MNVHDLQHFKKNDSPTDVALNPSSSEENLLVMRNKMEFVVKTLQNENLSYLKSMYY
jgi:hypothetical protein